MQKWVWIWVQFIFLYIWSDLQGASDIQCSLQITTCQNADKMCSLFDLYSEVFLIQEKKQPFQNPRLLLGGLLLFGWVLFGSSRSTVHANFPPNLFSDSCTAGHPFHPREHHAVWRESVSRLAQGQRSSLCLSFLQNQPRDGRCSCKGSPVCCQVNHSLRKSYQGCLVCCAYS